MEKGQQMISEIPGKGKKVVIIIVLLLYIIVYYLNFTGNVA